MTETLLLEAWEDFDAVTGRKMLYLLGEVELENKQFLPILKKKELPGLPESNLILEIAFGNHRTKKQVAELIYSEEICDGKSYNMVTIFQGNRVVAELTEFDHLVIA